MEVREDLSLEPLLLVVASLIPLRESVGHEHILLLSLLKNLEVLVQEVHIK